MKNFTSFNRFPFISIIFYFSFSTTFICRVGW